jgi:hypothetical protein
MTLLTGSAAAASCVSYTYPGPGKSRSDKPADKPQLGTRGLAYAHPDGGNLFLERMLDLLTPWHFHKFGGPTGDVPERPLTLAPSTGTMSGDPTGEPLKATGLGPHEEELARWSAYSGVSPASLSHDTRPR